MIERIVKLSFEEDAIDSFKQIFHESKEKIVGMKGCHSVKLLQVTNEPHIFFTYSYWDSQEDLDAYRHSELFQETWKRTKILFSDKPMAWSVDKIAEANI